MSQNVRSSNWSIKKLGDIGKFYSGYAFPDKEQGGTFGIPFFKVSDMKTASNANIMQVANNYVSDEQIRRLKYKPIKEKAIIFAKIGAAIFLERKRIAENFLIDNNMMAFVPNECIAYTKLLFDTIRLSKYVQVGALPSYNASDLKTIKILLPPLPEQEKIAEILSCWDTAIVQIQNLIAEKKNLRHALADKLLSDNLWPDTELCELLNYEQPSKYLVEDVLDFDSNKLPVLTANKSFIIGSTDDSAGIYDKGDCVIFDDFTTDMKYVNFKFKVKSSAIKFLTPKSGICLKFVFEQMRRIKYPRGGHKRYWLSEFQYLTIRLPDTVTQHKIVNILSGADKEIDLLNNKLDVLKEQKKGLMQKLLTGEIRVKVDKKD